MAKLLIELPSRGFEFWCDEDCDSEFRAFFGLGVRPELQSKDQARRNKALRHRMELISMRAFTRDVFEKECIGFDCIWSLKFFKGGENTRVFCQWETGNDVERIVFAYLIEKKKQQKLNSLELQAIKRIARTTYIYHKR